MSAKGIEEVKRLATKGLSGDEEAIKELGLEKVPEVTIPDFKEIDRFTVDKIKNVAAISFVVGKKVGLPLLEASAKNLYELVKFVEKDKLKTNTKPEMDRSDVVRRMSYCCKDIAAWSRKIGEVEGGKVLHKLEWFSQSLTHLEIGNKESLRLIGLKRMPAVTIAPIKKVPNSMTLQCYYKRAHLIASTAEYMGNTTLRIVSQFMMAMCDVIARSHHPEEPELSADTDGQDVCETLNAEIEDIMRWVEHLAELRKKERADEEEEDDSDPAYSPESSGGESEEESETKGESESDSKQRRKKMQRREAMEIDSPKPSSAASKEKPKYLAYRGPLDLTKDTLFADYREAANCYLSAAELGLDSVVSSSTLALKYISYVAKTQFDIDLSKKHDINAIKRTEVEDMMNNMRDECTKEGAKTNKCNETTSAADGAKSSKASQKASKEVTPRNFSLAIKPPTKDEDEESISSRDDVEGEVREEDEKRSHHSKVRCRIPGCGMMAGDIKRHLKVMLVNRSRGKMCRGLQRL